jgi:hypothetical protein
MGHWKPAILMTRTGNWPLWAQILVLAPLGVLLKLLVFTDRPHSLSSPRSRRDWLLVIAVASYAALVYFICLR